MQLVSKTARRDAAHHVCTDDDLEFAVAVNVCKRGRGLDVGLERRPVCGQVQVLLPLDGARS